MSAKRSVTWMMRVFRANSRLAAVLNVSSTAFMAMPARSDGSSSHSNCFCSCWQQQHAPLTRVADAWCSCKQTLGRSQAPRSWEKPAQHLPGYCISRMADMPASAMPLHRAYIGAVTGAHCGLNMEAMMAAKPTSPLILATPRACTMAAEFPEKIWHDKKKMREREK